MPLDPPPLDDSGSVVPHNHAGIRNHDGIIRRISDEQVVFDEKIGARRISSMAFKASTGHNSGMSVDLEASILEAGLDPRDYVTTPRWTGSIRFVTQQLRAEGFSVGYDPLPENPHHGEVWGTFNKTNQRRLRQICEWFVKIDGVSIGTE